MRSLSLTLVFILAIGIFTYFHQIRTDAAAAHFLWGDDFESPFYQAGEPFSGRTMSAINNTNKPVKEYIIQNVNGNKKLRVTHVEGAENQSHVIYSKRFANPSAFHLEFKITMHKVTSLYIYLYSRGNSMLAQIKNRKFTQTYIDWQEGTTDEDKASFREFVFQDDIEYTLRFEMSGENRVSLYIDDQLITDKLVHRAGFDNNSTIRIALSEVKQKIVLNDEGNIVPGLDYSWMYLDDIKVIGFPEDGEYVSIPVLKENIISDVWENSAYEHPRLLIHSDELVQLRNRVDTGPEHDIYAELKAEADKYLTGIKSVRLDKFSNYQADISTAAPLLSLIYLISQNDAYANKAWEMVEAGFGFESWNLSNTIETATVCMAYGIAYDWLYDYLTQEQKNMLKDIIFEKGLIPAYKVYTGKEAPDGMVTWWPACDHNWNFVCNGGFGAGALAFIEYDEEICGEIVASAASNLLAALDVLGNNGGWSEGVSYWNYGFPYLYRFLAMLGTAAGTDYNLMEYPGLEESLYFPFYLTEYQGNFNFHDGSANISNQYILMFGARYYQNEDFNLMRRINLNMPGTSVTIYDLLWYEDVEEKELDIPLERYFDSAETVVFRNSFEDRNAVFVGLHGGYNNVNHGSLDSGTFVLSALGERWAVDLGNDSYALPGYMGRGANGQRWTYYRNRAEGSNTLVINPSSEPDQFYNATTYIKSFVSGDKGCSATIDLTPAYQEHAVEVIRKLELRDNRKNIILTDNILLKEVYDIYWFMHTKADVTLINGGKAAVLAQNGKFLIAELICEDGYFTVMDARPLSTSPDPEGQNMNKGIKKLTVHINGKTQTEIKVLFTPVSNTDEISMIQAAYNSEGTLITVAVKNISLSDLSGATDTFQLSKPEGGLIKSFMWRAAADINPLRGVYSY